MRRTPTAASLLALILGLCGAGTARAQTYLVLLDLDDEPTTGCEVVVDGEVFPGAEQRLDTVVAGDAVAEVTRRHCIDPATGAFGPPSAVDAPFSPPWPVGAAAGTDGSDVVESYFPLEAAPGAAAVRLGFGSSGPGGEDALLPGTLLIVDPLAIPTLSSWALVLLALALGAAGWQVARRRPSAARTALVLLALVLAAGVAWAAVVLDGDPADWTEADLAGLDPIDPPATGADLRAAFARVEDEVLFVRFDAFGNTPPTLDLDAGSPGTGSEAVFTEDGPAVAIAAAATVDDAQGELESATLTITNLLDPGLETLAADTAGTSIVASYAAPTLTLTGTDTLTAYQQVLRSVTYDNLDQDPDPTPRTVESVASDGEALSAPAIAIVEVVEVNDPPTVTSPISWATVGNTLLRVADPAGDGHDVPLPGRIASVPDTVDALTKAAPVDVDTPAALLRFQAGAYPTAAGGELTIDDDGDFFYLPAAGFGGPTDTVTIGLEDQEGAIVPVDFELTVAEVVWYIEDTVDAANNPAGGDGRSTDAFETLGGAAAAAGPGDYLLVFETDAPLDEGIALQSGQRLYGQRVEEEPVPLLPAGLLLEEIDDTDARPRIHRTNGSAVTVEAAGSSLAGVEIRHLDLASGDGDAIAVTTAGTATAAVLIDETVVGAAGLRGVGASFAHGAGTSSLTLTDNTIAADGAAIEVVKSGNGGVELALAGNTELASTLAAAVRLAATAGGDALTVVTLEDNSVSGGSAGAGMVFDSVLFDADPAAAGYQQVGGGATAIGTPGDGVGGAGLEFSNVRGDLAFADLDVEGVAGVTGSGTGIVDPGAGTGFRLVTGSGSSVGATGGPAVDLAAMTLGVQLSAVTSNASPGVGVRLSGLGGSFQAAAGSLTDAAGTAFLIDGGNLSSTYDGTIGQGVDGGRAVAVENAVGASASFGGPIAATDGTGISITGNAGATTVAFTGALDLGTGPGSRLTDGVAFAVDGNAADTSVTAADVDVFTAGVGGVVASGGGTLDVDELSIDTAGARALDLAGIVSRVDADEVSCTNAGPCIALSALSAGSATSLAGLDLACTAGPCFDADAAHEVAVTGTDNAVAATGAVALRMTGGTSIGPAGARFRSISSSNAANGIVLDSTGSGGLFEVTGDGATAGSGGTIRDMSGADGTDAGIGIRLDQVDGVAFRWMELRDFDNFAVRGTGVRDFTLADSVIAGVNGTSAAADEGSVSFDGLLGTALFENDSISGGLEDNVVVTNGTGVLDRMTVSGGTIGLNSTLLGNDGILVEAQGDAVLNLSVLGVTFLGARGDHIQANALGTSTMDVVIRDNTFENAHTNSLGGGVTLSGGSAGSDITMTYDVSGSTPGAQSFRGSVSSAITVNPVNGAGTVTGTIRNNKVGVPGVPLSGSSAGLGMMLGCGGSLTHTVTADANDVDGASGGGFDVTAQVACTLNATITDNVVDELGEFSLAALYTLAGGTAAHTATVCADVRGNSLDGTAPFSFDVYVDQLAGSASSYHFPGYAGPATGGAALDAFLGGQNTLVNGTIETSAAQNVSGAGAGCP